MMNIQQHWEMNQKRLKKNCLLKSIICLCLHNLYIFYKIKL